MANAPNCRTTSVEAATVSKNTNKAEPVVFRCSISWDTLLNPVVALCAHFYCYACIRTALLIKMKCPICNRNITCAPIRDDALELELFDAIRDGHVDAPQSHVARKPYDWSGLEFDSEEMEDDAEEYAFVEE
ncbi:hypothetical protein B0H10DRAFT_2230728 [Mycena sp. CBHHK59/15]|nr:hypothetical protein B0H10DRAFT_2230728 [Mycena sp. CBHHK59/15]